MSNTLASVFSHSESDPAILTTASSVPKDLTLSYADLKTQCVRFHQQAESLFGGPLPVGTVVSSYLPNGLNCLLVFLATTLQRCVAAPLNPAMKQSEVEFYLEDASSKVFIIPEGVGEDNEGVKAARKLNVAVWTAGWEQGAGIKLAVLNGEAAKIEGSYQTIEPQADD
ncbi:hypothetical protein EC988_007550, partial [Linderina pennispora]